MTFMTLTGPRDFFAPLYWGGAGICAAAAILTDNVLISLATIIIFGLPHGALDGEMARQALRPRLGYLWFPVFALPYLALVGLVLITWHIKPLITLNLFLALSVWHFGGEMRDNGSSLLAGFVLGGAPLILPCVFQPEATAALLSAMAPPVHLIMPPLWLIVPFPVWALCVSAWLGVSPPATRMRRLWSLFGLIVPFALLPPLQAFMIYFVAQHAPAHIESLIADCRWCRLSSAGHAFYRSLPLTFASLGIGAVMVPFYAGPLAPRMIAVTFQLLAALTLPHMIFDYLIGRAPALREARTSMPKAFPARSHAHPPAP
ncbi:Brp/Blh family beta-carotene 15,15'-dioxygenase [Asaia bogorensis]|uniref:Brp/Blh family beta-carotene 15,15'-dioxygenase n=1 Tax=Asaia bogorensis TaxID=91915 RepID=UPI000EFA63A9|nr:Brp/Blh family beta-carotene 15,15'-dioxygenase [Asaia bogorensis]